MVLGAEPAIIGGECFGLRQMQATLLALDDAFGDLLPGIVHLGQDTYTAQIAAVLQRS